MIRIMHPAGARELRRPIVDGLRAGVPVELDLIAVADADHAEAKLAAGVADWLEVTVDGGSSWHALPEDPSAGFDLGPLTSGDIAPFTLRITPPVGSRRHLLELPLGVGT